MIGSKKEQREKEMAMLLFLLGSVVGGILGMVLISILSMGAIADKRMEFISEYVDQFSFDRQHMTIHK
jgi:hypothetical protein